MTHLTREEVARWRESAAASDRERIVTHLAECDECAGLLEEDTDRVAVKPAPLDPDRRAELHARAYAAYRPAAREATTPGSQTTRGGRLSVFAKLRRDLAGARFAREDGQPAPSFLKAAPTPYRAMVGGMAAAALLALALYPFVNQSDRPLTEPGESSVRGAIQLVAPAGTARPPVVFEWTSGFTADWFELEVSDESGAQVWRTRVTVPRAEAPAGRLEPGKRYRWRVTAWAGQDRRLESASRSFVVSPVP